MGPAERNFCLPLVFEILIMGPQVLTKSLAIGKDAVATFDCTWKEHVGYYVTNSGLFSLF